MTLPLLIKTQPIVLPEFMQATFSQPIEGRHSERAGRRLMDAPRTVRAIRMFNGIDGAIPESAGVGRHHEEAFTNRGNVVLSWPVDAQRPSIRHRIAAKLENVVYRLIRKEDTLPTLWPHDGHTITNPVVRICRDMDTAEFTIAWNYEGS